MVEPALDLGGVGEMLPGGCGTAGTPAAPWGLAALMWVCNKGLCLGEILLLLLYPPWACSVWAGMQPLVLLGPLSGLSHCPRGLQRLWMVRR